MQIPTVLNKQKPLTLKQIRPGTLYKAGALFCWATLTLNCALNPFYRQEPPNGAEAQPQQAQKSETASSQNNKTTWPLATAGKPAGKGDWTSCKVDADCIRVKADCCGCSSGGSDMAINKQSLAEYRAAMARCVGTICAKVYKCQGVPDNPSCVAGQCRLLVTPKL